MREEYLREEYLPVERSEEERKEDALRLEQIGVQILCAARDELYFSLRFMDVALSSFTYQADGEVSPAGTDGHNLYFQPRLLGAMYRENRILVNRLYLHIVLHGIFRHMTKEMDALADPPKEGHAKADSLWQGVQIMQKETSERQQILSKKGTPERQQILSQEEEQPQGQQILLQKEGWQEGQGGSPTPGTPDGRTAAEWDAALEGILLPEVQQEQSLKLRYWNLSCDIAAEHIIDGLDLRPVRFSRSLLRRETYRKLEKTKKTLHAEQIYAFLLARRPGERELTKLEEEFRTDDHRYWPAENPQKNPDKNPDAQMQTNRRWEEISEKMETDLETFSKEAGEHSGDFLGQLRVQNRSRQDYREFLRRFSVFCEETHVDPDSFDYGMYSYGLSLYGDMPLIEPQETREVKRLAEFAVVIDTSMSCSGEWIRRFLEETYRIFKQQETWLNKVNVHIIQCDEQVLSDKRITSQEEMEQYMADMPVLGGGGTDFRPAFAYVDELEKAGEFQNLQGLIYFTDGYGVYPERMPHYRTAFVFLEENYRDVSVPPWAVKLILRAEDLQQRQ